MTLDCSAGPKGVYVVDVDGAPGAEILYPQAGQSTFTAFRFSAPTQQFVPTAIGLPVQQVLSQNVPACYCGDYVPIHFLDVNGDGLSASGLAAESALCHAHGASSARPLRSVDVAW
jgi:exosome complex RNA-binding protein Rrp42 (RNase PH superfamily)